MLLSNEYLVVLMDGSWSSALVLVCGLYAVLGLVACCLDAWNVLSGSPDRLFLARPRSADEGVCDE